MNDAIMYFGRVGHGKESVISGPACFEKFITSRDGDYVKLVDQNPPDDEKNWVVDETGGWVISMDKEHVRKSREAKYLAEWPIGKQLEAIVEHLRGNSKQFLKMCQYIDEVKGNMPYKS